MTKYILRDLNTTQFFANTNVDSGEHTFEHIEYGSKLVNYALDATAFDNIEDAERFAEEIFGKALFHNSIFTVIKVFVNPKNDAINKAHARY